MKYALVNGIKTEATPKAQAECLCCGADVTARCGSQRVWHWAHKNKEECNYSNKEAKTQWHIGWQNQFDESWQECICRKDGICHIADIKTSYDLVVEFQHSAISQEERLAREQFYENMIWVVDGSKNQNDYKRFVKKFPKLSLKFKKNTEIPFSLHLLSDSDFFNQNWLPEKVPVFFDFRNIQDDNKRKYTYFYKNIWGVLRMYRQLVVIEMEFNYFIKCIEKNVILDILNTSCDLLKK